MSNKLLVLFVLLVVAVATAVYCDKWVSVVQGGGDGLQAGYSVDTSADSSVFVAGSLEGGISIGNFTLDIGDMFSSFVSKFSKYGDLRWIVPIPTSGQVQTVAVKASQDGNEIYITGLFIGNITMDDCIGVANPGVPISMFVIRVNSNGRCVWISTSGDTLRSGGSDIAFVDSNILVVGQWNYGGVIIKYNKDNGTEIWRKVLGAMDANQALSTDTASDGSIFVCGQINSGNVVDGMTFPNYGGFDAYLMKFDPSGNIIWGVTFGGTGDDGASSLVVDPDGNIVVVGLFYGSMQVENITLTTEVISNQIFIGKFDTDGNLIWIRAAGGMKDDVATSVAFNQVTSEIIVSGAFTDSATFDSIDITSAGSLDVFLARYSSDGEILAVSTAGGTGDDFSLWVALSPDGSVAYVTGGVSESANVTFGDIELESIESLDMYLALIELSQPRESTSILRVSSSVQVETTTLDHSSHISSIYSQSSQLDSSRMEMISTPVESSVSTPTSDIPLESPLRSLNTASSKSYDSNDFSSSGIYSSGFEELSLDVSTDFEQTLSHQESTKTVSESSNSASLPTNSFNSDLFPSSLIIQTSSSSDQSYSNIPVEWMITLVLRCIQGGTTVINKQDFSSSISCAVIDSDIAYHILQLTNGVITRDNQVVNSFTQKDVNDGSINFVHNGLPAPILQMEITTLSYSTSVTAQIIFKAQIDIVRARVSVTHGKYVVLSGDNFQSNDTTSSNDEIVYSVSAVVNGIFTTNTSDATITRFSQNQLNNGQIIFYQDGKFNYSTFQISVANDVFSSPYSFVQVQVQKSPSQVNKGAIIGGVVGGVGFLILLIIIIIAIFVVVVIGRMVTRKRKNDTKKWNPHDLERGIELQAAT
jgi:hypothetical protein